MSLLTTAGKISVPLEVRLCKLPPEKTYRNADRPRSGKRLHEVVTGDQRAERCGQNSCVVPTVA
jgi:hypothetical protein